MPVRQQQGVQEGRSNEEAGPRPRNDAPALTTCTTVAAGGGEPDPLLARGRRTKLSPVAERAPEETRTLPDLPSCRRRHLGHTVAAARQPPHRSAHNPKSIQGDDFKKQTEPRASSPPNKVRAFTREARGRGGWSKRPEWRLQEGERRPWTSPPWISPGQGSTPPTPHPAPGTGEPSRPGPDLTRWSTQGSRRGKGRPDLEPQEARSPTAGAADLVRRRACCPRSQAHRTTPAPPPAEETVAPHRTRPPPRNPTPPAGETEQQKPRRHLPWRRPGLARWMPLVAARREGRKGGGGEI